jgi:hypothetical protein
MLDQPNIILMTDVDDDDDDVLDAVMIAFAPDSNCSDENLHPNDDARVEEIVAFPTLA